MSVSGVAERTCRMLKPCFRAVETTDRRRAKIWAPSRVRNEPEIFILTFIILRSCSARLLVKGTSKSVRNRSVSVLNFFSLMSRLWPGRCFWRFPGLPSKLGQFAMKRQAEPDRRPISVDKGRNPFGRERLRARPSRFAHGGVGLEQQIAHEFGPGLGIEFDQTLEFAQDMGVAEGVGDLVHPTAVGSKVVVHDNASFQFLGDRASLSPAR